MLAPILSAVDSPCLLAPLLGIKHRARGEVSSWKSSLSPVLAWTRPVQILSSSLNPSAPWGIEWLWLASPQNMWLPLIQSCGWGVSACTRVSSGSSVPALKTARATVKPNPQGGRKSRRLTPRRQMISVKYRWACISTKRAPMSLDKGKGSLLLAGPESGRNSDDYSLKQPARTQRRGLKYDLKDCARALRLDSTNTQLSPLAQ